MTLHVNNFLSWVEVRELYVNDSGTWRSIREAYVNDGGTWRTVFLRGITSTMVAANIPSSGGIGYSSGEAGSMTNVTLHDGKVITYLADESGSNIEFAIGGFSSDPGQGYLTSLAIDGQGTLLGVNASFYSYVNGTAQWSFSAPSFVLSNGVSYTVRVSA